MLIQQEKQYSPGHFSQPVAHNRHVQCTMYTHVIIIILVASYSNCVVNINTSQAVVTTNTGLIFELDLSSVHPARLLVP